MTRKSLTEEEKLRKARQENKDLRQKIKALVEECEKQKTISESRWLEIARQKDEIQRLIDAIARLRVQLGESEKRFNTCKTEKETLRDIILTHMSS